MEEDWDKQVVFAMMDPSMTKIYSPWDSYTPTDCLKIMTMYEWTMTKIQLLEDENLALKTSVPRDDSAMDAGPVADTTVPEENDESNKYIILSDGQKLMRPAAPPATKSSSIATQSSSMPSKPGPKAVEGGVPYALPSTLKTGWKPKCVALIVAIRLNLVDRVQSLSAKYLGDKHVYIIQARAAIHDCFYMV